MTVAVKPVPLNSAVIPPKIASGVMDVSESKGVGAGRIIPLTPPLIVPLTSTTS